MTNLTYRFITLQPFNRSSLSSTMTHLDCSQCGSEVDMTELCLKDYPSLESIHIGSYSFPHILIVEVRHLPKLKQFVVKDHCFMHPETIVPENACCVEDCPFLESISIGMGSFFCYSLLQLRRDELEGEVMARTASSEVAVCGR